MVGAVGGLTGARIGEDYSENQPITNSPGFKGFGNEFKFKSLK
jgi:hypothetical protein